ncbi:hypothetical protein EVAR_16896_1 [Eumeta japonica]|uniref:Uncharacterized protein n=1 Tax=Eumeta variegata TaxID=151549 RepID=A0A4C1TVP1_EUMVA|nr:hypothetical protein EVAR_16896_1 [Eumeta japonica]
MHSERVVPAGSAGTVRDVSGNVRGAGNRRRRRHARGPRTRIKFNYCREASPYPAGPSDSLRVCRAASFVSSAFIRSQIRTQIVFHVYCNSVLSPPACGARVAVPKPWNGSRRAQPADAARLNNGPSRKRASVISHGAPGAACGRLRQGEFVTSGNRLWTLFRGR